MCEKQGQRRTLSRTAPLAQEETVLFREEPAEVISPSRDFSGAFSIPVGLWFWSTDVCLIFPSRV